MAHYIDLNKRRNYNRIWLLRYRTRWRLNNCCAYCGIPCYPFKTCKKHRKKYLGYSKQYRMRKKDKLATSK